MNNYYSLRVELQPCTEDATDLLAAFLADEGYESFEPDSTGITAYVREEDYDPAAINRIMADFPIELSGYNTSATLIEGQDWNHEWEKNYFKPIVIADRCVVRSSFHTDAPKAEMEILIDPKMAFGTGHHATTTMMATWLLDKPPVGKRVIDMGTGTGLLAILAKKLGASEAEGIEIDPAAYSNALENADLNDTEVKLHLGDAGKLAELQPADVFLANINRNIILADMSVYASKLCKGGHMYLSGFYPIDANMLIREGQKYGLNFIDMHNIGEWASLHLVKLTE